MGQGAEDLDMAWARQTDPKQSSVKLEMTVQQLIDELMLIEDKSLPVRVENGADVYAVKADHAGTINPKACFLFLTYYV